VSAEAALPVIPIADAAPGEVVRVIGTIGHILVEPGDAPPALTATVADDTGEIDAVFMGRRAIAGIEPGRVITVEGRVARGEGRAHIFNPWYELNGSSA
jgi:RecJ-like exonuclease